MLPSNMVITNFRKGKAYPHKLVVKDDFLETAAEMIALMEHAKGERKSDIEDSLQSIAIQVWNPKVAQGMVRLLIKRAEFSQAEEGKDPVDIRREVFSLAAERWKQFDPDKYKDVFSFKKSLLNEMGVQDPRIIENTEDWLFGDIAANQILIEFQPVTPGDLLNVYNISQVQGILLNALYLEVSLSSTQSSLRKIFQMLKFFGLMFQVEESKEPGMIKVKIDGPASILEHQRSYGLELAMFFPAILLLNGKWSLSAELKVTGKPRTFFLELDSTNPYRSTYTNRGIWYFDKLTEFINNWNQKTKTQLKAELSTEIIPLSGNRYLVADFQLQDPSGKIILIEWLRYITDDKLNYLEKTIEELPNNYLFVIKGSHQNMKPLKTVLGKHLFLFKREMTVSGLERFLKEVDFITGI